MGQSQLCVLCGKNLATTKEHIPPKNIFREPRPNNLIRVPSCKICNSGSSKDDEYFLHFLVTSISPDEHSDLEYLLGEKVIKSLNRKEALGLRKDFFDSLNQEQVVTKNGTNLGRQTVRYINADRILRVVEKSGRGLYYQERKKIVPESAKVEVMMIPIEVLNDMQQKFDFLRPNQFGNSVFEYSSIIPSDCDTSAGFYLKYFNLITFFVSIAK